MNYFLAKTDPETYSISDLEKDKTTVWDGVHSYAAINVIKTMKPGDMMLIYHSQGNPAIVGCASIISEPRQNEKDPRVSWIVDISYEKTFKTPVSLKEIKGSGKFADWSLIKQSRLSTMPVPEEVISWLKAKGLPIA